MATSTLAPPRRSTARSFARIILWLIVVLVVAVVAAGAWFYSAVRSAMPQLDGTIAVGGLSAPVTVTRDQHGVPHVTAASLDDLLFAQGYVTAQDRLWQMDMTRRYAAGELSEILGADLVKHDRQQRILGIRAAAEANVAGAESARYFQAYARGVNAFIESHRDKLPLEFRLLRYAPKPWTPTDCALVGATFSEMLNFYSMHDILDREKVAAKLSPELVADLFVNSSWRDNPPAQEEPGFPPPLPKTLETRNGHRLSAVGDRAEPQTAVSTQHSVVGFELVSRQSEFDNLLVPGSNDWVVSGAHTASGKPLLSNDMHLQHTIPNTWYEMHLHSGDFDVIGFTAPGLPFVIVGHNQRIAWGFTNVGPSVLDLYIEKFNEKGEYETPQGWRPPERRREVIHVKGQADVTLDVESTRHGPIVSELVPGDSRRLALKWTLYAPGALNAPLLAMDSAQNWDEFKRALSGFPGPSQNAVYADIDGHIGYHTTGWIPIRAAGDGSVPVPGNDDAHEWTGYVPFDELPSVYDPATGIIATANGRITPDGYKYPLSPEWGSPYRTERIYRVLRAGKSLRPADMLALQTDIYSAFDRFCAQRFVYAADHSGKSTARAKAAADILRRWDGQMTIDSAAATIETVARRRLNRLLLEPKLGAGSDDPAQPAGWQQYHWFMSSVWLENTLERQPARWLPPGFTSWDEVLAKALDDAVTQAGAPADLSTWKWGEYSPIYLQHPVFGKIPLLDRWSGPGLHQQSGGGFTVKQVGRTFGPSERMTVDFSDLDHSTMNIVAGESGDLFSPYYTDQWKDWYEGTTFEQPFTAPAVEHAKSHQLVLK